MITDDIKSIDFYSNIATFIKEALEFIKINISSFSKEQRYEINDRMYAIVETSYPKKPPEQKLEAHRKYIDVQYIIEGYDVIGWKNLLNCKEVYKNYDELKDIIFFNDKHDFDIFLNPGTFAVFFPQDAHAPLCGKKPVKKCIVKINVQQISL
ncbi:MAG: YhcH/YjgK/YiaL family protein [Endomicrobium sp.]|jgi:YhcH/YjgK/YiaL family protein|nr:YhcH/YjgK/YiaL family protein [Endomicrobium sp.]